MAMKLSQSRDEALLLRYLRLPALLVVVHAAEMEKTGHSIIFFLLLEIEDNLDRYHRQLRQIEYLLDYGAIEPRLGYALSIERAMPTFTGGKALRTFLGLTRADHIEAHAGFFEQRFVHRELPLAVG